MVVTSTEQLISLLLITGNYSFRILSSFARCLIEKANRVIYVTDMSQGPHFKLVFSASQQAGYVPSSTTLEHIGFGLVLGEDGKRLRSRSDEAYPLRDLVDGAIAHAREIIISRRAALDQNEHLQRSWDEEKIRKLSNVIGIGAVKYADLSMNRESGYKFSFEKMLSLDGNTAPYMLYAYVRIHGIYRKAQQLSVETGDILSSAQITSLTKKEELALALHLIKFYEVIEEISVKCCPHRVSLIVIDSNS